MKRIQSGLQVDGTVSASTPTAPEHLATKDYVDTNSPSGLPVGGTTGQVLGKVSTTDYDVDWVDQTGVSPTIIDAKGDLIVGSASDTPAKLTVGADYSVLQALASESTGTRWMGGAWTPYTPTLLGFTLGNGTVSGSWMRLGNLVIVRTSLTFGTTTAAATAVVSFTNPINAIGPDAGIAWGWMTDASTTAQYHAFARINGTTLDVYRSNAEQLATFTTTTPFTWTTGDMIRAAAVYEVA